MRFVDLDRAQFSDATIFLDVDGTLIADRETEVDSSQLERVRSLARTNDVYLCSNRDEARTARLAVAAGAHALPLLRKPRTHAAITSIPRRDRTLVIGDKFLTDGLFALRIQAEFIKVDSIRSAGDVRFARFSYALDALAWRIAPCILVSRPMQWIKNLLVFAPAFFAGTILKPNVILAALAAFVAFSLAASAVYVLNDIFDREQDRAHPRKRFRPVAAGSVSVAGASVLSVVLIALSGAILGAYPALAPAVIAYVVLNYAYTAGLKHLVLFDIPLVSTFYVLRVIGGGEAIGAPLSYWIVVCTFFGAAILTIGKRLAEYAHPVRRRVLAKYSQWFLRNAMVAAASGAVATYTIWSVFVSPTPYMGFSTLFVAIALTRVVVRLSREGGSETPEWFVFTDRIIIGSFVVWALYVGTVLYLI